MLARVGESCSLRRTTEAPSVLIEAAVKEAKTGYSGVSLFEALKTKQRASTEGLRFSEGGEVE